MKPKVFAGMPHYGLVKYEAVQSLFRASLGDCDFIPGHCCHSLLTNCFNSLLADALNMRKTRGITHFAMLHADVEAAPGWLDLLWQEMQDHEAGLVSAVIPLKDKRGVTSTAIGTGHLEPARRLTLREVFKLPETFSIEDTGCEGKILLVNTGCFLMDITQPWAEQVLFHIGDQMRLAPDGRYKAECWPEDWGFSVQLAQHGVKVMATRKIQIRHHGNMLFGNDLAWGDWDRDRAQPEEFSPIPALEETLV